MKFSDLPDNSFVLYTYHYSDGAIIAKVGKITDGILIPVYCSNGFEWAVSTTVMDNNHRANIISLVASLEDAKHNFPEHFI